MNTETKQCQNCKSQFTIEPEDFNFYEKIKVPAPTFCPECRLQRKLIFRNIRNLYKRKCDAPGHTEDLISIYRLETQARVYDQKFWWSDAWDATEYGKSYDFSRNFFEQFGELMREVPWPNLVSTNSVNSDYCNSVLNMKNCYLIFAATDSENCGYGEQIEFTKDSFDLKRAHKNELCYETLGCNNCYRTVFSAYSDDCSDCAFVWDSRGCTNCFGCVGLRNKSYYIFNKPYSREEYFERLKQYNLGSFKELSAAKAEFFKFSLTQPRRYARIYHSVNSTGDNLKNAKNCMVCFESFGDGIEDSRYADHLYGKPSRDCHSVFTLGGGELCYESISIRDCSRILFSKKIWTGHNVEYSYNCHNCSNIFGCVGLRNKNYCILNKQYGEREYNELIQKIKEQMMDMPYTDQKGRLYKYGEFFPPELSFFAYNETVNLEYSPLRKSEAEARGYKWKERDKKHYQITKPSRELPDHISEVNDSILNEVIGCAHEGKCDEECITAFKLIPQELAFYNKMNLPLPRLCHNCRHFERLKQKNLPKLWHRACQCNGEESEKRQGGNVYKNTVPHFHGSDHCPNEFETSYAPERPEIVYCENCYNSEVV